MLLKIPICRLNLFAKQRVPFPGLRSECLSGGVEGPWLQWPGCSPDQGRFLSAGPAALGLRGVVSLSRLLTRCLGFLGRQHRSLAECWPLMPCLQVPSRSHPARYGSLSPLTPCPPSSLNPRRNGDLRPFQQTEEPSGDAGSITLSPFLSGSQERPDGQPRSGPPTGWST